MFVGYVFFVMVIELMYCLLCLLLVCICIDNDEIFY